MHFKAKWTKGGIQFSQKNNVIHPFKGKLSQGGGITSSSEFYEKPNVAKPEMSLHSSNLNKMEGKGIRPKKKYISLNL